MEALNEPGWAERYRQQARWTWPTRQYIYSRLQAAQAQRVLEVGCGTGAILEDWIAPQALAWMQDEMPARSRQVVGIDLNGKALQAARQRSAAAILCRAPVERLPFPDESFDLVFCHYFLLWIKQPLAALAEMMRVLRPSGGLAVLAEPDHAARIDYPPPLERAGRAQIQALRQQGADPQAGRKVRAWLAQCGLAQVETGIMAAQWSAAPSTIELELEWWVYRQDIADDSAPVEEWVARDAHAWQSGERVLFVPTFYGFGTKPR